MQRLILNRKAFIVYLANHKRPMHQVVSPNLIDKAKEFDQEFMGMTEVPFIYEDFIKLEFNWSKLF